LSKYTVTVHELFKYMMHDIQARLAAEWQDLHVTYPEWVSTLVLDELYYTTTLVVMSLACFAMGMIIGIVVTMI
jgi:hypothetical protein